MSGEPSASSFREAALERVLDHAFEVYKDNLRVSSLLEDKAQKTATIAGVFLGASIAFTKGTQASLTDVWATKWLIFSLLCLAACILLCIFTMRVEVTGAILPLTSVNQLIEDECDRGDHKITVQTRLNLLRELIGGWSDTASLQVAVTKRKALRLQVAQSLLGLAVITSALSTVTILYLHLA